MADNVHDLNIEEEEQDQLVIDVNLLQTQMSTANTNITNIFSQTSGVGTSGLKSLIQSNDVDIAAIKTKTDFLTISEAVDLDNYDTINDMLQKDGNDTVLKTGAGNKIQFYQGGSQLFNSNEVKNLTDNVLISSGVNINTLDTDITGIKNNSLASTLKTAVDANTAKTGISSDQSSAIVANTAKNSYPSADATKLSHITSDATTFKHNKLLVGEQSPSQLIIQHGDINSGSLSTTDYSMRVTNNGELRLNVPTGQDYEFRINNVMQYNNTQIKNLVSSINITDTVPITNNLNIGDTKLSHNNLLVGAAAPDQLVIQHTALGSNISTTDYTMRVTAAGELRLNVPTGQDYEFRINNVFQYNNTQIKNLIDNITVAGSVNLDSIRNEINNINIQSTFLNYLHFKLGDIDTDTVCIQHKDLNGGTLADTHGSIKIDNEGNLKLNVPTSKTFEFQINNVKQYDNSELKNLVDNISVTQAVDLDTMESNIATNNAKITSNWTINGASEIHRNSNVGIKNSDPNVDLEIGDGTSNPVRIRLNGSNSTAISSEIIFTDSYPNPSAEFHAGASIRFNSSNNRLEFLTDEGNDGTAEPAMYIYRASTPYITTTNILSSDLSVQTCNLKPLSRYCYGKRVHSTTDTDSVISLTTSGVDLIYQNILSNGIVYNSSTGIWTVPVTGLYEVIATLNINCGSGPESVLSLFIKEGTTNILKARSHVSRAEGNNNTAMQLNMNGIVRLEASTDYNFVCASNNTGTGTIQNDLAGNNCLIIKGAVLQNDTVVPSDWNS